MLLSPEIHPAHEDEVTIQRATISLLLQVPILTNKLRGSALSVYKRTTASSRLACTKSSVVAVPNTGRACFFVPHLKWTTSLSYFLDSFLSAYFPHLFVYECNSLFCVKMCSWTQCSCFSTLQFIVNPQMGWCTNVLQEAVLVRKLPEQVFIMYRWSI